MNLKMQQIVLFVLVIVSMLVVADASKVKELDQSNFADTLKAHKAILVEFFAPWCGHCKALAPKYAAAAEALSALPDAAVASVDCTQHQELCSQFNVQGYPTLIAFTEGGPSMGTAYQGPRETDAIVSYLKKKILPSFVEVNSASALKDLVDGASVGTLVYFGEDSSDFSVFTTLSSANDVFTFGRVTSADVAAGAKATIPSLQLTTKSGKVLDYSDFPLDMAKLKNWVNDNGYPKVSEITQETYQRLAALPRPILIFVGATASDDFKNAWVPLLNELAEEFSDVSFTFGDEAQLGRAVSQFGGTGNVYPTIIGMASPSAPEGSTLPPRWAFNEKEAFTAASLRAHVQSIVDGSLKPFIKSEPIPEDNSGPVKILVADNFDELVLQSGKVVLVEFYAPWCGHCKSLAPIYEELGQAFASNANVIIAKIDATANYVDPKYNIQGFPTILLFTPGQAPASYEGARSLEALSAYVSEAVAAAAGNTEAAAAGEHSHDEL